MKKNNAMKDKNWKNTYEHWIFLSSNSEDRREHRDNAIVNLRKAHFQKHSGKHIINYEVIFEVHGIKTGLIWCKFFKFMHTSFIIIAL